MNTAIEIKHIEKRFDTISIFDNFSLDIEKGVITAIFGPNGSGKSTLCNILAGIIRVDAGEYRIHQFDQFKFSYIFQNYRETLLPWKTNFENVALPLKVQGVTEDKIKKKIHRLQQIFELKIDWNTYPYQLSGGQQQIIAFMRALITQPNILIIDEPFSALDYENNLRLRVQLERYYMVYKPTIVMVTHNIEEAVHLAKHIIVLTKKPTKVLEIVQNTIRYPRKIESIKTQEFNSIKDRVLDVFQKAVSL